MDYIANNTVYTVDYGCTNTGTTNSTCKANTAYTFYSGFVYWSNILSATTGTTPLTCGVKQEKEETAMSTEQNAIDYLVRRVENTDYALQRPLAETFNLYKDNKPKTYKELIDAIKNDKFKLDAKRTAKIDANSKNEDDDDDCDDFFCFHGVFDGIIFDGPQPDRKGYDAAFKDLNKAKTNALDIIKTSLDAEKRLQALKDFEAWTPTVTATVN